MRYVLGTDNQIYDLKDGDTSNPVLEDYFAFIDILSGEKEKSMVGCLEVVADRFTGAGKLRADVDGSMDLSRFCSSTYGTVYDITADNVTLKPMQTAGVNSIDIVNSSNGICIDMSKHTTDIDAFYCGNVSSIIFPEEPAISINKFFIQDSAEITGRVLHIKELNCYKCSLGFADTVLNRVADKVDKLSDRASFEVIGKSGSIRFDRDMTVRYLSFRCMCDCMIEVDLDFADRGDTVFYIKCTTGDCPICVKLKLINAVQTEIEPVRLRTDELVSLTVIYA